MNALTSPTFSQSTSLGGIKTCCHPHQACQEACGAGRILGFPPTRGIINCSSIDSEKYQNLQIHHGILFIINYSLSGDELILFCSSLIFLFNCQDHCPTIHLLTILSTVTGTLGTGSRDTGSRDIVNFSCPSCIGFKVLVPSSFSQMERVSRLLEDKLDNHPTFRYHSDAPGQREECCGSVGMPGRQTSGRLCVINGNGPGDWKAP